MLIPFPCVESPQVAEGLHQAGADPSAAYVLRIHPKTRAAKAYGRDYGGRAVSARRCSRLCAVQVTVKRDSSSFSRFSHCGDVQMSRA